MTSQRGGGPGRSPVGATVWPPARPWKMTTPWPAGATRFGSLTRGLLTVGSQTEELPR